MVPPTLLRARSFAGASAIFLMGYAGLSAVLFYVTLLYQGANGWSVLRTGLSWLLMNAPFLLMAQFAGRLDRRFPAAAVAATGCLVAALGIFALSVAGTTTPFAVTALGYLLSGAGSGTLLPATTHAAMRDVPAGVSGAASGVLNAARQIGSSVGLAVLGAIGVHAAVSDWQATAARFPAQLRATALAQGQNVGGARIDAVTRALGATYRNPAGQSFVHGYHLAVGAAAACLLAAAVVAVVGFGRHSPAPEPEAQLPAAGRLPNDQAPGEGLLGPHAEAQPSRRWR